MMTIPPHLHRRGQAIICASALATLIGLPHLSVSADDPVIVKTDKSGLVLDGQVSTAITTGPQLSAEEAAVLSKQLRTGFILPKETFLRMRPVPDDVLQKLPRGEGALYRMNDGKVYAFDPDTYAVLETVEIKVQGETSTRPLGGLSDATPMSDRRVSLKEGQIVPDSLTTFVKPVPAATAARLPAAGSGTFYAWLDGTMYRVKATEYTVVEVVTDEPDTISQTDHVAVVETPTLTVEQMIAMKKAMVKGYRIPDQHYTILVDVPTTVSESLPVVKDAEYRYLDGVVYTIDAKTRRVLDAATVEQITGRQ